VDNCLVIVASIIRVSFDSDVLDEFTLVIRNASALCMISFSMKRCL